MISHKRFNHLHIFFFEKYRYLINNVIPPSVNRNTIYCKYHLAIGAVYVFIDGLVKVVEKKI